MPVPDFSPGEVLTAAAMDSIGLWRVSTGSFSNVGSFDITGFTSTYKNFRVIMNIGRVSGSGGVVVTIRARNASTEYATGYFGAGFRAIFNGTSTVFAAENNGASFQTAPVSTNDAFGPTQMEISGMNTTSQMFAVTGQAYDFANSGGLTFGYQNVTRTISLDRLRVSCATNISGDWKVYGYREP